METDTKTAAKNDLLLLLFYRSYVVCASTPLSVMLRMTPLPQKGARLIIYSQFLTPVVLLTMFTEADTFGS